MVENSGDPSTEEPPSHATEGATAQPRPNEAPVGDPVEQALADAITKASAAGAWEAVAALTAELRARREARAGVVELASERRRRGKP